MHLPPVSDSLCFRKKIQTLRKMLTILPFPENFFDFHPPKFLMTLFSSIQSVPANLTISTGTRVPAKCQVPERRSGPFRLVYTPVSFPPYFDHEEFMHHTMHVLDAPAHTHPTSPTTLTIMYLFSVLPIQHNNYTQPD